MHAKVLKAFQVHNCKDCKEAITILDNIARANPDVEKLFSSVFGTSEIKVDRDPKSSNGFRDGSITISHAPLANGAYDKSLGDRMADSTIFESLNASRAADYATKETVFQLTGDVKEHGRRTSEIEVDVMADFIEIANKTKDSFRTGNMNRSLVRSDEAHKAKKPLKTHLLDAAHESQAGPKDYMSLPTRHLYVYETFVKSSPDQIKEIVLKRIGQGYQIHKVRVGNTNATKTQFKTKTGGELPATTTKLLDLLKAWPGGARQTSRPRFFLGFLHQVQNDETFAAFRDSLNENQFGFDDAVMSNMAKAQPA